MGWAASSTLTALHYVYVRHDRVSYELGDRFVANCDNICDGRPERVRYDAGPASGGAPLSLSCHTAGLSAAIPATSTMSAPAPSITSEAS